MELRPLQTADARPILELRVANRPYLERTEPDRDDPDARCTIEGGEWVDHLLWEKLEDD